MHGANSHNEKEPKTTLYLWIEPINKSNQSIAISIKSGGEALHTHSSGSRVWLDIPTKDVPTGLIILEVISMLIFVFLIIALAAFPFLFFNVIYNAAKNRIINDNMILKIRIMGWILTIYAIMNIILGYASSITASTLVHIENHKIAGPELEPSIIYLIIGFVTLLLAEIIRLSLTMKEEQDLTI